MNTLRASAQDYLAMRRSLGFKLQYAGVALRDFVGFMELKRASYIATPLALEWARSSPSDRPTEWARRLTAVRGFARYRRAIDPRTQVPPEGLLPYRPKRAQPYFYADQEIEALLAAALKLPPAGGLQGWTYHCLLGLLSVSGLRISEALNLKLEDLDLDAGVLTIHGTKFGKSRLVPLHPSSHEVLADYLQRFFTQRLMQQRHASSHTIDSYRDTFRLLLQFTQKRSHKPPARLAFEELDAPLITEFLDDLEKRRGIAARSRNLRLTAIRSFFHYAAFEIPAQSAQIQRVLADTQQALYASPDRLPDTPRSGRTAGGAQPRYLVWTPRSRLAVARRANRCSIVRDHRP